MAAPSRHHPVDLRQPEEHKVVKAFAARVSNERLGEWIHIRGPMRCFHYFQADGFGRMVEDAAELAVVVADKVSGFDALIGAPHGYVGEI